ncbi:MAG TPA: BamA/TamA family outer membrane protein [Polyangiaceae bacterium]|nr:BamA/TamA family outer membrane protein [Polyangiaceae bacterium]
MRAFRLLIQALTAVTLGSATLTIAAPANAQDASTASHDAQPANDADTSPASNKGKLPPKDDGWPDLSSFLDQKYGFLPIAMPITEPAVGYGAAGGLVFLSKSLGEAAKGLGRPNITFVGGMGTANGSWGAVAADIRYWMDDHVQTLVGGIYASVNLDFYGIGADSKLESNPIRYNLSPKAGTLQGKYRFGDSHIWAGFGYAFASTKVTFDAPDTPPNLPDHEHTSNVGVLLPSLKLDTRDNVFTPLRGVFLEASAGIAGKWLGGDNNFVRAGFTAIQYLPLPHDFYFGLRMDGTAAFGDSPFYVLPYIGLRGVPVMRYQGEEVLSLEGELRWQFWKRWSILGFAGAGNAWNNFEKLDNSQGVVSGGGGFRYELARKYGIHMGVDLAFSRDTTAFYVQAGSAWGRP